MQQHTFPRYGLTEIIAANHRVHDALEEEQGEAVQALEQALHDILEHHGQVGGAALIRHRLQAALDAGELTEVERAVFARNSRVVRALQRVGPNG